MRHLPRSSAPVLATLLALTSVASLALPAVAATRVTTAATTASQALGLLTVANEANSTTYDRALFPHWIDADRDCQNTRAEVLLAETDAPATFTTTSNCTVATGSWTSWYDGATWTLASDVDIDHVVALKEAWESGASKWTTARSQSYANDMGVSYALDAITDNVNQSKSDLDPAAWMPPLDSAKCRYATTWVLVKYRWRLTIDSAEKRALAAVLTGTCGSATVTLPARP